VLSGISTILFELKLKVELDFLNFRHDYQSIFEFDLPFGTKADRLIYGESAMTHAMAFTAVSLDVRKMFRE